MLRIQKEQIAQCFTDAVLALAGDSPAELPKITLDRPRQAAHGDLACSVALQLAKALKAKPRDLAERLVAHIDQAGHGDLIESLEIAGPGFINIRVSDAAKRVVIAEVFAQAERFGRSDVGQGKPVMVEFVSANPTGPLHVGHGRQAALGDTLAALLDATGWRVQREFYYNDAGAQIDNLARSVQARARGVSVDDASFPKDGYRGDYIAEIGADYLAGKSVKASNMAEIQGQADLDKLDAIRDFAVAYLRAEQDIDLRSFGVKFDHYYLESSLYSDGLVDQAVQGLKSSGHTEEREGALWLKTTDFGDDKDRVMRKSTGGYTYFVPDVAYHVNKWQRGFERVINVQGSDHHGTIARVRAGLQAMDVGIKKGFPSYVLHKMVTVTRGGQEVKISKRAGSYVTLRDLIAWSGGESGEQRGRDAVRFFLVSRKADTEFVFDVDLAVSNSDENPVYYVQYAHARICSVLSQHADGDESRLAELNASIDLSPLTAPREASIMALMASWPEVIEAAADDMTPHSIAFYLKDLAGELHSYYNAERFLVDDMAVRQARLCLLMSVRQVLQNGLTLLGVSAPQRM